MEDSITEMNHQLQEALAKYFKSKKFYLKKRYFLINGLTYHKMWK